MMTRLASLTCALVLLAACGGGGEEPLPSDEERLAMPADPVLGRRLFRQCAVCHDVGEEPRHRVGPNLNGIMGAEAGRHPDFSYSASLKRSGLVWDEETLDAYIEKPQAVIPGGRMAFQGEPSEANRRDIIAYLKEATAPQPEPSED
ncbi:cytochrome c family protein [Parvularcula sp. ZS-1/3]|uniref:Cytochrome c family protein n=1 Tax=Parvularcula mediterranea TaxID=2732508 RepID=A0A7Y3RNB3_9PROT|nr:cytochrome c family protein [Parvularcula mediterranea]NNU17194.1 cytochrome c family protein [Parvularcula mediterranea]